MKNSSDDNWKEKLTPEQYNVCRLGGTESPFSGKYYKHKEDGTYICVACKQELFSSQTKFESGTGWPSFWDAVSSKNVTLKDDFAYNMHRVEVLCANCGSHLGHVFEDGPAPYGPEILHQLRLPRFRSEEGCKITMDYPFVAINNNFKIEIATEFDFDQSNPLQYHYLFKYTIMITNIGNVPAQLVSRKWNIKDERGDVKHVEGPGVIGQTPHFAPGKSFEYQSFCPLPTMRGEMWGHFNMVDAEGQTFKIDTPVFKFHVPKDYIDSY